MTYRFSQYADESLEDFSRTVTEAVISKIDEAAEENFYGHKSYSFVYDHHGDPWDKLDLKEGPLNHRVFFMKKQNEILILDIFERDNLDYEERGFYNQLRKIADK